ncbi:M4 family metallopeptidase [Massilia sp. PAMC28688]|uniref:M4 family metallopeptidase n=1 Tax=Massilia sp. PAMC28688 TaxID=2861283 RepID=UPI001C62A735|nr:M4 family metallopeptidase [Massilia sp. PAMC28688]QYF94287.1 M4 family metallopeptidase [Massilia sp. PAMC28688]
MKLQTSLLAASMAALPLLAAPSAHAAAPLMGGPVSQSAAENASVISTLMSQRARNALSSHHGFAMASRHPGEAGTSIARFNHTYKGVRVYGSESVVVTGARGKIVSESASDRRAGLGRQGDLDVTPAISSGKAIALASASAPNGTAIDPPSAELLVYPIMKDVRLPSAARKAESELNALDVEEVVDRYVLAYLVKTRTQKGQQRVFRDTIVNARTGAVIEQWDALQTVAGTGLSQYNGSVPLNTTLSGSTYSMIDPSRGARGLYGGMAITNANHTSSAGAVYTNATNTWGDGKQYIAGSSTTNANGQTAAVNAMWGLMNTYDMYKNTLGWQSLDGQNTATYIAVHVNTAYDNAYYSDGCKCMFIGDGGTYFTDLGSIDVIGHEMSHGVTAATSNLAYRGESGGLNESHSDIGGEVTEAYARAGGTGTIIPSTGNDWMTGKEIARDGIPLRYMYKPSKDGRSADAWSRSLKRLDVHYSSGPNNRMFYFLSQGSSAVSSSDYHSRYLTKAPLAMTGIGSDKAFRIWFKALSTKFTSSTNYADARSKVLAAAQELYGVGSREAIAVQRAYAAINVGLDVAE